MSLIVKCTVKDKGAVTWPPIKEPGFGEGGDERLARNLWLRSAILEAAEDARTALGTLETTRVHVQVTFRPDIMVDA